MVKLKRLYKKYSARFEGDEIKEKIAANSLDICYHFLKEFHGFNQMIGTMKNILFAGRMWSLSNTKWK